MLIIHSFYCQSIKIFEKYFSFQTDNDQNFYILCSMHVLLHFHLLDKLNKFKTINQTIKFNVSHIFIIIFISNQSPVRGIQFNDCYPFYKPLLIGAKSMYYAHRTNDHKTIKWKVCNRGLYGKRERGKCIFKSLRNRLMLICLYPYECNLFVKFRSANLITYQ